MTENKRFSFDDCPHNERVSKSISTHFLYY